MNQSPRFYIFTDDIMEQIEFRNIISNSPIEFPTECSPDTCNHQGNDQVLIVNLHLWNLDPYLIISLWKELNVEHSIIFAYTSEKHDHPSIHKAKAAGAQYVLEKHQLHTLLSSIISSMS